MMCIINCFIIFEFSVVPPPRPPTNLGALNEAELLEMEGQERRHLEARIRVLRDIQTLLDAAVLQMNQYGVLVARLEQEANNNTATNGNVGRGNTSTSDPGNSSEVSGVSSGAEATTPPVTIAQSSFGISSEESASAHEAHTPEVPTADDTNLSDQERIRRRRLQRFNGMELN